MTTDFIQATGNLLATYRSDLTYIRNFHRHLRGQIPKTDYLKKSSGTFKLFINEFRVARNIDKTQTEKLLTLTLEWVDSSDKNNVDSFARQLCKEKITHGKIMTSLASKILFLNNPWTILPLDRQARATVGLQDNKYSDYVPLVDNFVRQNKTAIKKCLSSVDRHLTIIEKEFKTEIKDIKTVRQNRFTDKLLWTFGRQK